MNQEIKENVPTVSGSSGAIAGVGIGPQGEPGVPPKPMTKKPIKRFKKFIRQ